MMLKLQRYNLNVIYKRGKELFVADALSRAHLSSTEPPHTDDLLEVMTLQVLSSQRTEELRSVIKSDTTCQRLVDMIMHGWPISFRELSHDVRPFFAMREEFVVENGLIFRGQRLLIPIIVTKLLCDSATSRPSRSGSHTMQGKRNNILAHDVC